MILTEVGPYINSVAPAPLQVTLLDAAGAAANVTSHTIKFLYWPVNGAAADVVERTGAAVTAASGIVKYVWVAADMVPGSYRGRMWSYSVDETVRYSSDLYCWIVEDDPAVPAALIS